MQALALVDTHNFNFLRIFLSCSHFTFSHSFYMTGGMHLAGAACQINVRQTLSAFNN